MLGHYSHQLSLCTLGQVETTPLQPKASEIKQNNIKSAWKHVINKRKVNKAVNSPRSVDKHQQLGLVICMRYQKQEPLLAC